MALRKRRKITPKAPRSEAQREQARINGAKSQGPKTEEGKAISRENAVTHGFSGRMLVGKGQRKVLNHRIKTFEAEAGPRAMHQGLAGFAAIAMTRAEAIGESRHRTAEANCRRIRRRERDREANLFDQGEALVEQGKHAEGLAKLAEIPAGCMRIADRWFRLTQSVQAIGPGTALNPEHWEEIDRLRSTIPPDYRPRAVAMLNDWRKLPDMPIARFAQLAMAIAQDWERSAQERRDDLDQELKARMANARADLGSKGQARERYFNKAHSIYRNAVQQIDAERRHRDRMRNEPENSSQDFGMLDFVEIDPSSQTGPAEDGGFAPTPDVVESERPMPSPVTDPQDEPCGSMRNEPENSPQSIDHHEFAKTDMANPTGLSDGFGVQPLDEQSRGWHALVRVGMGAHPEALARPGLAGPDGHAHAHADVGMPPGRRQPLNYHFNIPGHPGGREIPHAEVSPCQFRPRKRKANGRIIDPARSRTARALPERAARPVGGEEAASEVAGDPSSSSSFEERFGHLDPRNLEAMPEGPEQTAAELALYRSLPGLAGMTAESLLENMRRIRELSREYRDDPIKIDDVAQYWAERGDPFAGGAQAPP